MRRSYAAAVLSLLLHLALFLALRGEKRAPPGTPPIELEIVVVQAPKQEEAEPGQEVGERIAEAAAPPRPSPRTERGAAPSRGDLPPEAPPAEPPPGPERAPPRREEDGVWREAPPPTLDLYPRVVAPELEPSPAREEPTTEDRLHGLFDEDRAKERALKRADPELVELRRTFERHFSVPLEYLDEAPRMTSQMPMNVDGAVKAWFDQAQAYGAEGNPYGDGPLVPGARGSIADEVREFRLRQDSPGPDPLISETTATTQRLVAQIEILHGEDGAFLEVRLVKGSGVPRYDRLALRQAEEAARRSPGTDGARRSIWAFFALLKTTPPAPIAGCSVDPYFIPQECFYPGSKHMRTRVVLEAIHDR